jgi:hypothetical protein
MVDHLLMAGVVLLLCMPAWTAAGVLHSREARRMQSGLVQRCVERREANQAAAARGAIRLKSGCQRGRKQDDRDHALAHTRLDAQNGRSQAGIVAWMLQHAKWQFSD